MKKNILLSLFLINMLTSLMAQTSWFPTAADQPVWKVREMGYMLDTLNTYTAGEEVDICGKIWTQIVRTVGEQTYVTQDYYRVDGARVYYRFNDCSLPGPSYNGREYLMYDFSLEAGDSVYIGLPRTLTFDFDTLLYHVYATDTVCYGGALRKVLEVGFFMEAPFDYGWYAYRSFWVEGIGDVIFPFPSMVCTGWEGFCESYYSLNCLTINGSDIVFSRFSENSCDFPAPDLQRIYVDSSASDWGRPDGSDWACAFPDLQSAIARATPGDTIWVAQGTYFPASGNNREVSFHLPPGVTLLGGFAGHETRADQRDWENHPAILSGDIQQNDHPADNSYHVVYALGADSAAVLDGFTITGGYAVHANPDYFGPHIYGGGLFVDTNEEFPVCEPRIRNCRFTNNVGKYGGGVYCNGLYGRFANPAFENCVFYRNRGAVRGGGVYKTGPVQEGAAQRYVNCTFEENWAWQGGGAVCLIDACDEYRFENCIFLRDSTYEGGGALYWLTDCANGKLSIQNCHFKANHGNNGALTFLYSGLNKNSDLFLFEFMDSRFEHNTAFNNGGGALGIFSAVDTTITQITNCIFDNNISSDQGAGILVEAFNQGHSIVEISSSVFKKNKATGSPGAGAIFLRNDVISNYVNTTHATISNCLFYDNGGAFALASGYPGVAHASLINCTLNNNGAFPIAKNWSEDFVQDTFFCSMSISNSVLWEPGVSPYWLLFNQELNANHFFEYAIHHSLANQPICNLPASGDLCDGGGMLSGQNPRFVDPAAGDFRVSACSPAIDAGSDADSQVYARDLAGNPRTLGAHTDMGAFERAAFSAGIAAVTPASCSEVADGAITFSLNGDAPYTISWQDAIGQTGSGISNLAPGEYRFFIEDRFGCKDTVLQTIDIRQPAGPYYTVVNASSPEAADGAILLDSLLGGLPPYTYSWSNGEGSPSLTGLLPGEYSLTLTDAGHCVYELDFTVSFVNVVSDPTESMQVELFPNPASAGQQPVLRVTGYSDRKLETTILDGAGRSLHRFYLHFSGGDQAELPVSRLPAGLYWVKIRNMDGFVIYKKLIISKR